MVTVKNRDCEPSRPDREFHKLEPFLLSQRGDEEDLMYDDAHISRGLDRCHIGSGQRYNQIHGLDYTREAERHVMGAGRADILDVGCGLGYFIKDMRDWAHDRGWGERVNAVGLTLTRSFKVTDTASGEPAFLEPLYDDGIISEADAERMPYPDKRFQMVVSTFGPYTYYDGPAGGIDRKDYLLDEMYRVTSEGGTLYIADNRVGQAKLQKETAILDRFRIRHPEARVHLENGEYERIRIGRG
jgi:SAM-dependent methyltransferase